MPRADNGDYRKAHTVMSPGDSVEPDLKEGLLDDFSSINNDEKVEEEPRALRPLTYDQKRAWAVILILSFIGSISWKIPEPLMIYLQSSYFNHGEPCISRNQTDSPGCKEALSTISFVSGWFSVLSGVLAFFLSPVIGKLSDSFGRRNVLLLCYGMQIFSNGALFFGQTPVMDKLPWLWIYYSLNVINIGGGVSSAYLADIMPPEWRSIAFGVNSSIYGLASTMGPLVDLIPFPGTSKSSIDYVYPFGITWSLNVFQLVLAFCVLRETLPPELRIPFQTESLNTFRQLKILWTGPTGISDIRLFRRMAFTVFVHIICMDGCFLVTGFYVKSQFAISKDMNTWMMEARGAAALFVMWVLFKPLIQCLGEKNVVVFGLFVDFIYFLGSGQKTSGGKQALQKRGLQTFLAGYLFLVTNLSWVFIFTTFGTLGMVNYPAISSIKSQKCSPAEQGRVLGSLSGVQSLSFAIGPLIFNNSYAFLTNQKDIDWMKKTWGYVIPEHAIWWFGIIFSGVTAYLAWTIPDPTDIYVPNADENLSITNSEVARRIRVGARRLGKSETEIAVMVEEALASQMRQRREMTKASQRAMADYRRGGAVETVLSPLDNAPTIVQALASHPYTMFPGAQIQQGDYRTLRDYRK